MDKKKPSMDLAIIGNCQYLALSDADGSINWLCWPRFDSEFLFCSLLDSQKGGRFSIAPPEGGKGSQQYLVNTNVLRTYFESSKGFFEVIDFAPRFFANNSYYKPTMLIRIVRPIRGEPQIRVQCNPVYDYGKQICRSFVRNGYLDYEGAGDRLRLYTNAPLSYIHGRAPFVIDKTHYFVLSYGEGLDADVSYFCEDMLQKTISYWHTWVKHCFLPRDYQAEVIRSALVLKLHQYEDTGAIIASATTSIPEADQSGRNWDYRYCWLRDAWFSLAALQKLNQFEEMESFVNYLRNIVDGMNEHGGRLQPVFGVSGESKLTERTLDHLEGFRGNQPIRIGNQAFEHVQNDVYGEMILAIRPLFLDQRFLGNQAPPPRTLLLKLLEKIELYHSAKDAGLWEFRGNSQVHTFSLLMHWAGASAALEIANKKHYLDILPSAKKLVSETKKLIHEKCWNDSIGAFTQAVGSEHLDASLLMMINLGFLSLDEPKAHQHINSTVEVLSTKNQLLHRYIAPDDFGKTENAFIICSFWLAEAFGHLGMQDKGREILEKLIACANPTGLYSEDLDPNDLSLWGNFPQTYSHVGLINAAFVLSKQNTPTIAGEDH